MREVFLKIAGEQNRSETTIEDQIKLPEQVTQEAKKSINLLRVEEALQQKAVRLPIEMLQEQAEVAITKVLQVEVQAAEALEVDDN